jgi:hypothetical protein
MTELSPQEQLEGFIDRYTPEVGALARAALAQLRARAPGAFELVYDNYNALAIGFSPSERASDAVVSLALYPRWVSVFFARGVDLPDPKKLLRGGGKAIRHVPFKSVSDLEDPAFQELITVALARAPVPFDASARRRLIIKSISEKQRARRPK